MEEATKLIHFLPKWWWMNEWFHDLFWVMVFSGLSVVSGCIDQAVCFIKHCLIVVVEIQEVWYGYLVVSILFIYFGKIPLLYTVAPHSKFRPIYHMPHHVKNYTNAIRPMVRCIWIKSSPEANKQASFQN